MSLPPVDTLDSHDGLAPVTPQRPTDGLHVHLEWGEADLLQDGIVVDVLAGGGHEEVMHCKDSVWGLLPSGLVPARPPLHFHPPSLQARALPSDTYTSIEGSHPRGTWGAAMGSHLSRERDVQGYRAQGLTRMHYFILTQLLTCPQCLHFTDVETEAAKMIAGAGPRLLTHDATMPPGLSIE